MRELRLNRHLNRFSLPLPAGSGYIHIMTSLWNSVASAGLKGAFHARGVSVAFADLANASCLKAAPEALRGCSVLLAMREQLSAGLALLELDDLAIPQAPPARRATPVPVARPAAHGKLHATSEDGLEIELDDD